MRFYVIFILLVALTSPAVASLVELGNLQFENTGSTIVGSDNYTYSSLNQTGLVYGQLLDTFEDVNSDWFGYSIATQVDAHRFAGDMLGGGSNCSIANSSANQTCGDISSWYDGMLGNANSTSDDYFAYINDINIVEPYPVAAQVGLFFVGNSSQTLYSRRDWGGTYEADQLVDHFSGNYMNYLLVKGGADVSPVPAPPAIYLLVTGLLGLGAIRRKQKKN